MRKLAFLPNHKLLQGVGLITVKYRLHASLCVLGALAFFTGCQTVDDRIKEKPAAFANIDTATQDKIKQGIIDLGYTLKTWFISPLVKPDQKRESANAKRSSTVTWVYNTYYQRSEGTHFAG